MCDFFNQSITVIKGVGQKRAQLFQKLGVCSVGALLRFYPRDYEDWAHPVTVAEATSADEAPYIRAVVMSPVTEHRIRKGMTLYKCRAADDDGTRLNLTFYNNPYIVSSLKCGCEYVFHGRVMFSANFAEMSAPAFRPAGESSERLTAVYPQTEGLPSRFIAQAVGSALAMMPDVLPDPIPEEVRIRQDLIPLGEALRQIHQPDDPALLDKARSRLIFEEFFLIQIGMLCMKGRERSDCAPAINDHSEEFFDALPFSPTNAQRRAVRECLADMSGGRPMARLLQGDVGSGKTAVAAALCVSAARSGFQTALMAPTEILAEQHFSTLSGMLDGAGIKVVLLTGSVTGAARKAAYSDISSGEADIVVGTHALISERVEFSSLGLVITDEQHRFGVAQRAALTAKGRDPHILVMSATPIPRTLAMMLFGDLDISVLDEMPAGRLPVKTYWIDSGKRERAYGFIKKLLDGGRQAYIVCPLVDDTESSLASAESFAAKLAQEDFAQYRVGLLHGRMKPADKDYVMRRFAAGELDLLVSTTVIEVGVDVPNAAVMLIENAERFGLSQLHQLRGRVGRGGGEAHCILVSDSRNELTAQRLKTMVRTTDGFEISEEDLRLRGPGDFFGLRQHGLPPLKLASFENDVAALSQAQSEARVLIGNDPDLGLPEHEELRKEVDILFSEASF